MAEQSYLFDFSRVDSFFENINIEFNISDMYKVVSYDTETGEYEYEDDEIGNNFELVICERGEDNIESYLDANGQLTVTEHIRVEECALDYYNRGYGSSTIELHGNVTFHIGDANVPIKAIFLRSASTGYVMGYSINMRPFQATNEVVFDDDVIFWDISRFNQ